MCPDMQAFLLGEGMGVRWGKGGGGAECLLFADLVALVGRAETRLMREWKGVPCQFASLLFSTELFFSVRKTALLVLSRLECHT